MPSGIQSTRNPFPLNNHPNHPMHLRLLQCPLVSLILARPHFLRVLNQILMSQLEKVTSPTLSWLSVTRACLKYLPRRLPCPILAPQTIFHQQDLGLSVSG